MGRQNTLGLVIRVPKAKEVEENHNFIWNGESIRKDDCDYFFIPSTYTTGKYNAPRKGKHNGKEDASLNQAEHDDDVLSYFVL